MDLSPQKEFRLLLAMAGLSMDHASRLRSFLGSDDSFFLAGTNDLVAAGLKRKSAEKLLSLMKGEAHLREAERVHNLKGKILYHGFPEYPAKLLEIPFAPCVLFVLGQLPDDTSHPLAIVGSRRCTPQGRRLAEHFGKEMAGQGLPVVSGLARGIDTAAIHGCLQEKGWAVGVLGCGLDIFYPSENRSLYKETAQSGAIISEFPLGTGPLKGNFPRRNRIISGLCEGVLIVEASEKSGSLITADHALCQNRAVMAVPGPTGPVFFKGTNTLIRDGACVVLEPQDILAVLKLPYIPPTRPQAGEKGLPRKGPKGRIIKACLHEPRTLESLAAETGIPCDEVIGHVAWLEVEGFMEHLPGGRFFSCPPRQ